MVKKIREDCVAIYIRWSTEDQGEGTTLAVQLDACRHYVRSQGWHVQERLIFIDDGYSGGSLQRPALTRLRRLVQKGLVDCVVVYKLDRLSRSVVDTVNLVMEEWCDLTYLKSAREPIDTTTAMGKQFFYMLVSYAEWERSIIRERTFSGRLRRAREGKSPGMPRAFGYRSAAPGSFELVPEEAAAVRLMFQLAAQGAGVRQITLYLNRHGFPTRKGGPWSSSTVSKILRNPIYTGTLVWGRRQVNPRHRRNPSEPRLRPSRPHVVRATELIPAIVSQEQFAHVQTLLKKARSLPPAVRGSRRLLSGLLQCGLCGGPMEYNAAGSQPGWAYYRCRTRAQKGKDACTAMSIPAPSLEQTVVDQVLARYRSQVQAQAASQLDRHRRQIQHEIAITRQAAVAQLARLEQQCQRIDADYRQERLTASERRHLLEQIESERESLRVREQSLAHQACQLAEAGFPHPDAGFTVQGDIFRSLSPSLQKQVLQHLLKTIQALRRRTPGNRDDTCHVTLVWREPSTDDSSRDSPSFPLPADAGG